MNFRRFVTAATLSLVLGFGSLAAQAPGAQQAFDWGRPLTSDEVQRFISFWSHYENLNAAQIAAIRSGNWATATWPANHFNAYHWESARFSQVFYRASLAMGWLNAEKDGQDPEQQWAEAQAQIKEAMNNPNVPAEYKQMIQSQMGIYAAMRPERSDLDLLRPHYDRLIRIWQQFDDKLKD